MQNPLLFLLFSLSTSALRMIANCSQNSLWNQHECSISALSDKYQNQCIPRMYLPFNSTDSIHQLNPKLQKVKGVVVFFHGFTACPDAFDSLSLRLSQDGYMVLSPLLPGQGLKMGYDCQQTKVCTKDLYNPSEIPKDKKGYINWSLQVHQIVLEQISLIPPELRQEGFRTSAVGLSAGGALALFANELPGSPYQNLITVNALLASTSPPLDYNVKRCLESKDVATCLADTYFGNKTRIANQSRKDLVHKAMLNLSQLFPQFKYWAEKLIIKFALSKGYANFLMGLWNKFDAISDNWILQKLPFLDSEMGWGEKCHKQVNDGRGGICSFRVRHLLALQSFTSYLLGNLDRISPSVQVKSIQSDLEGGVRDSISVALSNKLGGTRCSFPVKCTPNEISLNKETQRNDCGAPHSLFSEVEALATPPFKMYWQESLFDSITQGLGTNPGIGQESRDVNDIAKCIPKQETLGWGFEFDKIGTAFLHNCVAKYKEK